jgi:hypothetical protein
MRPKFRAAALILAATMALGSTTALAADENSTATITDANGATATFDSTNTDIIMVTFESDKLEKGNQYLIMMVKGTEANHPPTESTILYIDQKEAEEDTCGNESHSGYGKITFEVYPSSIQDSVIVIYGASGETVAAIVDAKYILGDVTKDLEIDSRDALMVLKHSARRITLEGDQLLAADVNHDQEVNAKDALLILKLSAHLITEFPDQ